MTTLVRLVTSEEWNAAARRSIFFGHQSVGENMLDGLRQISATEGWPGLRVAPAEDTQTRPGLRHAKIGQNGDPRSKIQAFRDALTGGLGNRVDVAVMKFCFWDIRRETDIEAIFNEYRATLTDLARRFPSVTFIHATVPLVAADMDWRARVRRLMGTETGTDIDNATRERFNGKIRNQYHPSEIFDIARSESDGAPAGHPQLVAELSSDGAHLNDDGRRRVGAAFIRTIAAAPAAGSAQ